MFLYERKINKSLYAIHIHFILLFGFCGDNLGNDQ
jgi:hypothetical protein